MAKQRAWSTTTRAGAVKAGRRGGDRRSLALPGNALMAASTAARCRRLGTFGTVVAPASDCLSAHLNALYLPPFSAPDPLDRIFFGAKTVPKRTAKYCKCLRLLGGGVAQLVRAAES
jgi:hypothetical protein